MIGTPSVVIAAPREFTAPPRNADFSAGLDGWAPNGGPWTVDGNGNVHPTTPSGVRIGLQATADNMIATGAIRIQNGTWTLRGYTPVAGAITEAYAQADTNDPAAPVTVGSVGSVKDIPAGEFSLTYALNLTTTGRPYVGPAFRFQPAVTSPFPDLSAFTVYELSWTGEFTRTDVTCLCDDVAVKHGRDDATGQPDASSATVNISFDSTDPTANGPALVGSLIIGAPLTITLTLDGTAYTRFTGTLTDITTGWADAGEETPHMVTVQVVGVSPLARLGRTVIGATPWPQELDGARIAHILAAAAQRQSGVTYVTDPGTAQILGRDVDSQAALGLLHSVAESAEGTLWQRLDGYVCYADANRRTGSTPALTLDDCDLLVSPEWKMDMAGLVNSVSLGYGEQNESSGDQPHYEASDYASISLYGLFDYSLTTELATRDDAVTVAQDALARQSEPGWDLSALPVDVAGLDAAETAVLLGLDMHALVKLVNIPNTGGPPTEALLWVEGWSESLTPGAHALTLAVSDYARSAGAVTWDTWGTGTWNGTPSSVTWNSARQPPAA